MTLPGAETIIRTVENLQARGVEVIKARTGAEAKEKTLALLPEGAEVQNGTSTTLNQIGITEALASGRYNYWGARLRAEGDPDRRLKLRRQATGADYFLGGVNAIAESGDVVCADASGSRISAYIFPAGKVIWVASAHKIVPTLTAAIDRLHNVVFPREDARMKASGAAGSNVGKILIFRNEQARGRVTLVLITGEEFGF